MISFVEKKQKPKRKIKKQKIKPVNGIRPDLLHPTQDHRLGTRLRSFGRDGLGSGEILKSTEYGEQSPETTNSIE